MAISKRILNSRRVLLRGPEIYFKSEAQYCRPSYKPSYVYQAPVERPRKKAKDPRKPKTKQWFENIESWAGGEKFVKHLLDNKIYEDENMIVLDKPSGLPMVAQGYGDQPGMNPNDVFSIFDVQPLLRKEIGTDYLKQVYSQPRLYSGVVILAKSIKATQQFKRLFIHYRTNKIKHQTHRILVEGKPKIKEGDEKNIPFSIVRRYYEDTPVYNKFVKKHSTTRADHNINLFEMECNIVKQIPVGRAYVTCVDVQSYLTKWEHLELFMTMNYTCPVLGDHMYSQRVMSVGGHRIAVPPTKEKPIKKPQKLHVDIKNALKLKTEVDIKNVPLHIHGSEVIIPRHLKSRKERWRTQQLKLRSPMPSYFTQTCNKLGLELPEIADTEIPPKRENVERRKAHKKKRNESSDERSLNADRDLLEPTADESWTEQSLDMEGELQKQMSAYLQPGESYMFSGIDLDFEGNEKTNRDQTYSGSKDTLATDLNKLYKQQADGKVEPPKSDAQPESEK